MTSRPSQSDCCSATHGICPLAAPTSEGISPAARQALQRQFLVSRPSQRPLPQAWFSKQRRIERVQSRQERLVDTLYASQRHRALCLPSNVLQTADFPQQLAHVRHGIALQRSYRDKSFLMEAWPPTSCLAPSAPTAWRFSRRPNTAHLGQHQPDGHYQQDAPHLQRQGTAAALSGAA